MKKMNVQVNETKDGVATNGKTFLSSAVGKIIAGVLAATLVVGAVVVGTRFLEEDTPAKDRQPHIHSYDSWAFDNVAHWQICECGQFSETKGHYFENKECVTCGMPQPVLSPDELLSYDCTTLAGHWINVSNDYRDNLVREFYVSDDGNFSIMKKTYYPIGSKSFDTDIHIALRETPYDSSESITEEELFLFPVTVDLCQKGDYYTMSLMMVDPETYDIIFSGTFYRESDYIGYEKVALTPENFAEYIDVTVKPINFYHSPYGDFSGTQYLEMTLREDLGYPSWCQVKGKLQFKYQVVEYSTKTQTYTIPRPSSVLNSEALDIGILGDKQIEKVVDIGGPNFPNQEGIIKWHGKIAEGYVPVKVTGYVFVPVEK